MRPIRHLAAMAGGACVMLGALAMAGPASAAPVSPHPMASVVPHDFTTDTITSVALSGTSVAFDQEPTLVANWSVIFKNRPTRTPVMGGVVDLREELPNNTEVDLCSNVPLSVDGTGSCRLSAEELLPGNYQIIAHFEGVLRVSNHSDSSQAPLAVTLAPATPQLTRVPQVFFGQESQEHFGVTVTSDTAEAPTGMFTVGVGGQSCGSTLANGVGGCDPLKDTTLQPGTYPVSLSYGGDSTHSSAAITPVNIVVSPGSTSTKVSLSSKRISFGQQQNERLTAQVSTPGSGTPSGSVQFLSDGQNACSSDPQLVNGTASCNLTGQLPAGTHAITAVYSGDSDFSTSTSQPVTLTVTVPTTTALTLSSPRAKFGREQAEKLTVKVRSVIRDGTPRGTVTIKAGNTVLCRAIALKNGAASCKLTARKLRPGTYHLTASYPGAGPFTASTSPRKTLTITK